MDPVRALIPLVGIVSICLTLFAYFYLRSRENMALIDRGINPREPGRFSINAYLKYGLLMVGGGIGLLVAYALDQTLPPVTTGDPDRPALYFSLLGICGGIGLVIAYNVERKMQTRNAGKE